MRVGVPTWGLPALGGRGNGIGACNGCDMRIQAVSRETLPRIVLDKAGSSTSPISVTGRRRYSSLDNHDHQSLHTTSSQTSPYSSDASRIFSPFFLPAVHPPSTHPFLFRFKSGNSIRQHLHRTRNHYRSPCHRKRLMQRLDRSCHVIRSWIHDHSSSRNRIC